MRVLHVNLVCGHGGIETVIAALMREQRRIGIEADVFSFVDKGGAEHYEGLGAIGFAGRQSLTRMILDGSYDVVHVVTYAAASTNLCLKRSFFQGAVVVTSHGVGAYENSLACDAVTAVSRCVAESIQDRYKQPVRVVYNGVDTALFHPETSSSVEGPIIAWVGRGSDPHKDAGGLFALAHSGCADRFGIVMVDGSAESEEPANWLPDSESFRSEVLRRKPWKEMPGLYRRVVASRGFLLSTSRTEACPMNVLEAMACGCPVIAPAVGGIPELVEHQISGYLYDRADGLAGILVGIDWLYDGSHYERASAAAAERVAAHFGAEAMCAQYAELYAGAIASHRSSRLLGSVNRLMRAVSRFGGRSR